MHSQYIRQRKNRNLFPSSCLSPAEEGSRTLKVLLPHGPEPCASANSATSAFAYLIKHGTFKYQCGRWDLNPHDHTTTRSLVLPVCQFQHSRSTCYNIAQFFQFCNTFFEFFLFFHLLYTISLYAILGVSADNTGIAYVMGLFLSLQNFMMLGSKDFLTPLIPNCYVLCTPAILLFKN